MSVYRGTRYPYRVIHVGTSGWSYPSGRGTWHGVFYPKPRPRGFDELRYYADRFDTVEVNSTFYRVPDPGQVHRWIERTPDGFLFAVKLFQKFTHPDMFLARAGGTTWHPSPADVDQFRAGLDPLAVHGRLGALLLQFPTGFHADAAARDYIDWLLDAFAAYPLAVELRHRTWFTPDAGVPALLARTGAALVLADSPETPPLTPGRIAADDILAHVASDLVYLRCHGRNAAQWRRHDAAEDRYNYLYSPAELQPMADVLAAPAPTGRRIFAFMNNHFSAKAVANAAVLRTQLGQDLPGEYEPGLVARYPDLAGRVRTRGLPI